MTTMDGGRWLGSPERGADAPRVVVAAGLSYPIDLPGLFLPGRALVLAGWEVWRLDWGEKPASPDDCVATVSKALDALVAEHGPVQMLIGKSLGTFAARWAADRRVPAVWTTPLLSQPLVVDAINASSAPTLLIGGSEDPAWVPAAVTSSTVGLLEIPGANHGWQGGGWRREIDVHAQLTAAVEAFAMQVSALKPTGDDRKV